ncbi:outer membrane protein, adhesin transport system [Mariprofundus micogutta]|uniref:Outer membrane protein, adhesin transport system n=1 Tax=Mariprofundus micogutta TaxID=1921010 RepID=A0A1L8CPU3_9PROT|nr:OmpA family protein [Mariprofundus micogutta]GAV20945.1 outer membrane protein, adhesin transport system [Mariprofundus micogutta]
MLKLITGIILFALSACASSSISIDHDELSAARTAIDQARMVKADRCAPELLAKAQSSLYWAAHELTEHTNIDQAEASELIAKAETYARQARAYSLKNCKEETTVILLPDEDGNVGAVSLNAGGASQTVSEAFHASSVRGDSSKPEAARALDEKQVRKQFSDILKAQPPKPARFILYFVSGTSELTEASQAIIPQVLKATKERQPAEVSIVGHTDSTGSKSTNMKISSARAKAVELLLKASDSAPDSIYLRFHGENDPLVPTPDNVPEPKNRRVEILIL